MASSSRSYEYDIFPSFYGKDIRKNFLSHLLEALKKKMTLAFIDDEMKRGKSINPELVKAINESRICLVILSENYGSSKWCLDELEEITKLTTRNVMTIFYEVSPSNVRNQKGSFGKAFDKTCKDKTEDQKQRWRQALTYVANIAGEVSRKWKSEAEMVKKITNDLFNQLHPTPSSDCDEFVGIEKHLKEMKLLLCPNSKQVEMVGIWGPAGIGKTTIARVLYKQLSSDFHHKWFFENIRVTYKVPGLGNDSLKVLLQNRLLSSIFGPYDESIHPANTILKDRKVLLVLDDVDKIDHLDALAKETSWFGPGSRIIVTTENLQLLNAHNIEHIYKVDFPSNDEALQIFCQYTFLKKSPPDDFPVDLLHEAIKLTNNLPLALEILGKFLRGINKKKWEYNLCRTDGFRDVTDILRVGYDSLHEAEKYLFLLIACLFNGEDEDHLTELVKDMHYGLSVLSDKALIRKTSDGCIVMHYLLQQLGMDIVASQSVKPGERQFLTHARDIHDVLVFKTGTENVVGISLDISSNTHGDETDEMIMISEEAFEKIRNLQYLRIYKNYGEVVKQHLYLPNGLSVLPSELRLLHWDACPIIRMPTRFSPKYLVQLKLRGSQIEKLWEGEQRLDHLKKVDLSESLNLDDISGLKNAINLEVLDMRSCTNLKGFPNNLNLKSLRFLYLDECLNLRNFPDISTNIIGLYMRNAALIEEIPTSIREWTSLSEFCLSGCENLTKFPDVPVSIKELYLCRTGIEEIPSSIKRLSSLQKLWVKDCNKLTRISKDISELEKIEEISFSGCKNVQFFPEDIFLSLSHLLGLEDVRDGAICVPENDPARPITLFLSNNDFKELPYGIGRLTKLRRLVLTDCQNLESLPKLSNSLIGLHAENCSSLRSISVGFRNPAMDLMFVNCLNLDDDAKELIEQSVCRYAFLPGEKVPPHFTYRALGSSLTVDLGTTSISGIIRFKACVVLRKEHKYTDMSDIRVSCSFTCSKIGIFQCDWPVVFVPPLRTDHLFIAKFVIRMGETMEIENEVQVKFNCICVADSAAWEIKECGILEDKSIDIEENSSTYSDSDSNEDTEL